MIDIQNAAFTRLQDLYTAMGQDADTTDAQWSVALPADAAGRQAVEKRLIELFGRALGSLRSEKGAMRVEAAPFRMAGESDDLMLAVDAQLMIDAARRVMPKADDPAYAESITDREAGVISLLGSLVNLQNSGRDTARTIHGAYLSARSSFDSEKQIDFELRDLPFEKRKQILVSRLALLKQWTDSANAKRENGTLIAQFQSTLKNAAEQQFTAVLNALEMNLQKFAPTAYARHQWKNVLYRKLAEYATGSKQVMTTASAILGALATKLMSAQEAEQLTVVIDGFKPLDEEKAIAGGTVPNL